MRPGCNINDMVRLALALLVFASQGTAVGSSVFGVFVGSSPCDEGIKRVLQIPLDAPCELIEWRLAFFQQPATRAPAGYELRFKYGPAVPNQPGLSATAQMLERKGSWKTRTGILGNPAAVVYELDGTASLFKVSEDILHVLNGDRSLMVGTSGWSYTLNRSEASEPLFDSALAAAGSDESRTISPRSTGPTVFGVFEGRSPCGRIARELKINPGAGCMKVKWRVTLYQNPKTRQPTTYKIESTLHRRGPRLGSWTIASGTDADPSRVVYRLAPAGTEAAILLLKGDENVLFFAGQNGLPLSGTAEFSYTLNLSRPRAK